MKISVITINYNNCAGLVKTLQSVQMQKYYDFEHIVIDGGSTDGSKSVIEKYSLDVRYPICWLSEKDTGIYNAMNKGVIRASGDYLLMLNSGDYLLDDEVLEKVSYFLDGTDIIQGNTIQQYNDGTYRCRGYGRSDISFTDAVEANFLHQASFIKRTLHDQYGLYDESYQRSSDSYFYITCLALGNATFKYIDVDVTNFDTAGITSLTNGYWKDLEKEEDACWFGKNLSKRMVNEVEQNRRMTDVFVLLQSNCLIWGAFRMLKKIAAFFVPTPRYVKIEKIGSL